ncbi:MAG: hypothetical protein ACI39E_02415 [Acutalibacteraceae bacterium]
MADDLSEKLDRLFSSPDGMKRVEDMMKAFGISAPQTPFEQASAPSAAPKPQMPAGPSADSAEMPELDLILKLAPLIGQMGKEDENTALLHALRPYLRHGREKRLDESVQMLRMMKLLPLLQGRQDKGGDGGDG